VADMNLIKHPDVIDYYERTAEALYFITDCTDNEAEEFIESMATLIFVMMRTHLKESNATDNH
jgi:hypothetical protein